MNRFFLPSLLLLATVAVEKDLRLIGTTLAESSGGVTSNAETPAAGLDARSKSVPAGDGQTEREIRLSVGSGTAARHVPGKWTTLNVAVQNNSGEATEETAIVTVGDHSGMQYARKIWVPAGARRMSWLPVKIPSDLGRNDVQVPFTSIHLKQTANGEQFQADVTGMSTSTNSLMLSRSDFRTGLILGDRPENREDLLRFQEIRDTVYLGSDSVGGEGEQQGMVEFDSRFISASPHGLDSMDQLIIASDDILTDSAFVSRLQNWLQNGGQAWIMADRVSPKVARRLLGDVAAYHVIDRVQLNQFELQGISQHALVTAPKPESWSSEEPVDLVRVAVQGQNVVYTIDEWPAAFWATVGKGQVLFTTLQARGWVHDQEESMLGYQDLAGVFFSRRAQDVSATEPMLAFLEKEIGYEIPRRSQIAVTLGLYSFSLLAIGGFLVRRRSLQHLAWIVPSATLVAAGFLIFVGSRQTQSVPSTIATGQLTVVDPKMGTAQIASVSAIYSQQSRTLSLDSPQTTLTDLRQSGNDAQVRRLVWKDDGGSRWDHVEQPPGVVRHVESEATLQLENPWAIQGTFTPAGFQGAIVGTPETESQSSNGRTVRYEDALIVGAASPTLALRRTSEDLFLGGPNQLMSRGQFISDDFISDEQRNRQSLIRQIVQSTPTLIPKDRRLLVWTDPLDVGVEFDSDFVRSGSALTLLPIRLERVEPGNAFLVPSTFVDMKQKTGVGSGRIVFNDRTGVWLDDLNNAAEFQIVCKLPSATLPCELSRADLQLRVNAPSRVLKIQTLVNGQRKTILEKSNPNGVLDVSVAQADLKIDQSGSVNLFISISDASGRPKNAVETGNANGSIQIIDSETISTTSDTLADQQPDRNTWKIDYLRINFEGTAL